MLKFVEVEFGYNKDNKIIKNLSIEIDCKKIGIMGENGAGKTTLLKILSREYSYSGQIKIDDDIFYPIDDFSKYIKFTMNEIMEMISYLSSFDTEFKKSYIEKLNLKRYMDYEIGTLSKGTKKKLMLLLSLMSKSKVILLDEPFESIDEESNINFTEVVKDKSNIFIIVSHDYNFLLRVTEKIYQLEDGTLHEKC